MANTVSVKVDEKGRLSIPAKARQELGISSGDTFFFRADGQILQYAKVTEDPFEILAKHAIQEYREGKTISIEEYAKENRIPIKPKKRSRV